MEITESDGDIENPNYGLLITIAFLSIIYLVLAVFFNYQPYFVEDETPIIEPVINPQSGMQS